MKMPRHVFGSLLTQWKKKNRRWNRNRIRAGRQTGIHMPGSLAWPWLLAASSMACLAVAIQLHGTCRLAAFCGLLSTHWGGYGETVILNLWRREEEGPCLSGDRDWLFPLARDKQHASLASQNKQPCLYSHHHLLHPRLHLSTHNMPCLYALPTLTALTTSMLPLASFAMPLSLSYTPFCLSPALPSWDILKQPCMCVLCYNNMHCTATAR